MMKLSLIQTIDATLDDTYASPLANQILATWGYDADTALFLRSSANVVFVFKRAGQRFVLRFAHANERTAESIHAELAYLRLLAARNIAVALPVRSLAGNDVESVSTPFGTFHAVVFDRLSGTHADISELTPAQFTRWGHALGRLHAAAQHYRGTGRPTIHDHLAMVEQRLPPHEDTARRVLTVLQQQVAALPKNDQTFGLIHYDFELDNLLWNGDQVGMIDFDDSAWYWFVADIAYALRDLFDDQAEAIDLQHPHLRAFVDGYRMAHPMPEADLRHLPLFLRIHNMVGFTKLLRTIDAGDDPEAPIWLNELRAKLMHAVENYRVSFARYAATL